MSNKLTFKAHHTNVYISEEHLVALDMIARKSGVRRAQVIRNAIGNYLSSPAKEKQYAN